MISTSPFKDLLIDVEYRLSVEEIERECGSVDRFFLRLRPEWSFGWEGDSLVFWKKEAEADV